MYDRKCRTEAFLAAYAELTVCEASLYEAALDNDVARATALLAIPGVRPDGYRHARVRATLSLSSLSVCRLSPPGMAGPLVLCTHVLGSLP